MKKFEVTLKESYNGFVNFKEPMYVSAATLDEAHIIVRKELGWKAQEVSGFLMFKIISNRL